ncbi:MAG: M48 family metalloprotease [Bacteroidales bacterium]|nr:M48 family metalloprotease [Bacteroidales bacterium]
MRILSELLNDSIVNAIGWTIFHILWQGFVLAALTGVLLRILSHKSSQIRYLIALSALLIIVGLSVFNFTDNYKSSSLSLNQDEVASNETVNSFKLPLEVFSNLDNEIPDSGIIKRIFNGIDNLSDYFPLIVSLWFIGVIIFLIRFVFSYLYTSRLRTVGVFDIQGEWLKKFNKIKNKLNVKRTVRFIESTLIKVPVVLGYLKPVVLIPAEILSGMPMNQIEAIIAHELAHIRRNDYIINVIQTIIETVFFFHPAVWYLSSKISNERENCCDDIALTVCDGSLVYAKALVSIQDLSLKKHYAAVAFSGRKKHLLNRIKRMIMKPKGKSNFTDKIIAATIILSAIIALSFTYKAEYPMEKDMLHEINEPKPVEKVEISEPSVPTLPAIVDKIVAPEKIVFKDTTDDFHIRGEHYDIDNNTIRKVTRTKDGKKEEMKFTLKNGKVTELYIDGKEVPESEYEKYQSEIDEIIDDLKDAKIDIREAIHDIEDIDLEEIQLELQEAMKDVHVDIEEIQKDIVRIMEETQEINTEKILEEYEQSIKKMKESIDLQKEMEKWEESLGNLEIELFDYDEFIEKISLINSKIDDIDTEELRKQINESINTIDVEKIMKELEKTHDHLSELEKEEILYQMDRSVEMSEQNDIHKALEELEEKLEELENLELEEK